MELLKAEGNEQF